jgi:hypothetical protein
MPTRVMDYSNFVATGWLFRRLAGPAGRVDQQSALLGPPGSGPRAAGGKTVDHIGGEARTCLWPSYLSRKDGLYLRWD